MTLTCQTTDKLMTDLMRNMTTAHTNHTGKRICKRKYTYLRIFPQWTATTDDVFFQVAAGCLVEQDHIPVELLLCRFHNSSGVCWVAFDPIITCLASRMLCCEMKSTSRSAPLLSADGLTRQSSKYRGTGFQGSSDCESLSVSVNHCQSLWIIVSL